ncbi:MAG: LysM peptidoglycan-binding domain-containing protein [Christensenellaceae bacterium]|nr:LysM peptidoglycan-binding domain-containing protein [Christensenellaceae bacterium]
MENYFIYEAKHGETAADIAEKFGCTKEMLEEANGSIAGKLEKGCLLRIPGQNGCKNGIFYQIKQGETLVSIAKREKISLQELLAANPCLDPLHYTAGQIILLPKNEREKQEIFSFIVTRAYPLHDILRRFDISVTELRRLNPGIDIWNLYPGMEIFIREAPIDPNGSYDRIREDEDIAGAAKRLGLSVMSLLRENSELRPSEFTNGQRIRLPKS